MFVIYLIQDEGKEKVNIEHQVLQWIEENNGDDYQLVLNPETKSDDADVWFFNVSLNEDILKLIKKQLKMQPDLSICLLVEPKELSLLDNIKTIEDQYPFSKIGIITKPIQYYLVRKFLNTIQLKTEMVTFDSSWSDDDFDILD